MKKKTLLYDGIVEVHLSDSYHQNITILGKRENDKLLEIAAKY